MIATPNYLSTIENIIIDAGWNHAGRNSYQQQKIIKGGITMKRFLAVLLTLAMVMTAFTGMAFADNDNGNGKGQFKDIKGHWGMGSIMKLQNSGILQGYEDGTFRPEKILTMNELAVIIDKLTGDKLKSIDDDEDIDDDDDDLDKVPGWAKNSVKKGFKHGYLNLKRFHSQVQVNRLLACVAIAKALEEADLLEVKSSYDINPFKDKNLFKDADDYRYILALYEAGYIKGNPDGNFNPNGFLNRAHIASIIANLMDDNDDDDDDVDKEKPEWDEDSRITAFDITDDSVTLKWSAAEDNEGVTGYKVLYELDDVDKTVYVSGKRTVKITGLEADTEYEFTVLAGDTAGNWSKDSLIVKATTLEKEEAVDTEEPYWAQGSVIDYIEITEDSIEIEWDSAKDNVAVEGYEIRVYRDGGLMDTFDTVGNEFLIEDLDDDTEYKISIRAYDKAGNKSVRLTAVYTTSEDN